MFNLGQNVVTVPLLVTAALAIIAIVISVVAVAGARASRQRIGRLMRSESHENLEETLTRLLDEAQAWRGLEDRIKELEWKQRQTLSKTGMVRYNPFDDTGADLSFSLALLSEERDGVVVTSLWGRDEVRVFAKPIEQGSSRYALSSEEKQALDLAANQRMAPR